MFFFNEIRLINEIICVERRTQKKFWVADGNSDCLFSFFVFFSLSLFSSFFGYSRQYGHLKYLVEKSLGFVCTGCHNIYPQNMHVLEMRNFHRLTWRWWTYGRTILSEPKYLGCIDNQIFLPMMLLRARFTFDSLSWKVPFSVGIANLMELVERSSLQHSC